MISTGCVAAAVLNLVFSHLGKGQDADEVTHPMEAGEDLKAVPAH